jgi:hypothetical protein
MFKKILYIGSGDDLKPIDTFRQSQFVYIDSSPRNEYGYPYYYRGFYKKNFKKSILKKLSDMSFVQTNEKKYSDLYSEINVPDLDSHLVTFERNDHKTFKYYFSTGIPENIYDEKGDLNQDLCKDIYECDSILIKGHWPNKEILSHIKTPIHFIGSYGTFFPQNIKDMDDDFNNIIFYFLIHPEKVSFYSYLNKMGEITTFQTYNEFYQIYKKSKEMEE